MEILEILSVKYRILTGVCPNSFICDPLPSLKLLVL